MRRPVPSYAAAIGEGRPIAELNMTPLIDELLVLIVMFIMVIPAATHEIPVTLPGRSDVVRPVTTHRLAVARGGAVTLNGVALNEAALATQLRAVVRDEQATLVMRTDPAARYERFVQVLAVAKRGGGGGAVGVRGVEGDG